MMINKLSNISLIEYRRFLIHLGCKQYKIKGGHEHWTRADFLRPITLQTHIDPVPEFIVKQHALILGLSKNDFIDSFNKM